MLAHTRLIKVVCITADTEKKHASIVEQIIAAPKRREYLSDVSLSRGTKEKQHDVAASQFIEYDCIEIVATSRCRKPRCWLADTGG
jgi:hypothetical protein